MVGRVGGVALPLLGPVYGGISPKLRIPQTAHHALSRCGRGRSFPVHHLRQPTQAETVAIRMSDQDKGR